MTFIATPALAADFPAWLPATVAPSAKLPPVDYYVPRPVSAWQLDLGTRLWFGTAKTGKSLFDVPSLSNNMVSRLTYGGMSTSAGEIYGRVSFTEGWFLKGYVGGGVIAGGTLRDEDFPPAIIPYSNTTSEQHDGSLSYASVDAGYNVLRGGDFRVGAFAGYHYFREDVSAFGCAQTATNPFVCQPAIPNSVEVITQDNHWQSLRVGADASVLLWQRLKLSAEAAYLPVVWLNGTDSHWLRIGTAPGDFAGPIPEDGRGSGYQFEASLSYQITPYGSIGVGARYWHMQANGFSHFENDIVGFQAFPQPVDWKSDIYGVFVQGSIKLGPYPTGVN